MNLSLWSRFRSLDFLRCGCKYKTLFLLHNTFFTFF